MGAVNNKTNQNSQKEWIKFIWIWKYSWLSIRIAFFGFIKFLIILPTNIWLQTRVFLDMNLTIIDLRTCLTIENLSDLMFISINISSVKDFKPRPYVKIWLQDHRSPRGKKRKRKLVAWNWFYSCTLLFHFCTDLSKIV